VTRASDAPDSDAAGPAPTSLAAGTRLLRIYDPTRHGAGELSFRANGPRMRFDHHRGSEGGPADDPERAVWYGGLDLETCVLEVFGPLARIELTPRRLALPIAERALELLDLSGEHDPAIGDIAWTPERQRTWAFAREVHGNAGRFAAVDGIIWPSGWTGRPCVALFERAREALRCPPRCSVALTHPRVADGLLRIAGERRLGLRR
jgi:hypothetical protein